MLDANAFKGYMTNPGVSVFDAALAFSAYARGDSELDYAHYHTILSEWSEELRAKLRPHYSIQDRIVTLNNFLFSDKGFHPDDENFYDPKNNFIDFVMDARTGVPVTMGILYIELGKRIGLTLHGVSFPGHFLVMAHVGEKDVLVIDPYHQGASLDENDLIDLIMEFSEEEASKTDVINLLSPASSKETLLRVMRSLKSSYIKAENDEKALEVMNFMIELDPEGLFEIRDRGLHLFNMQYYPGAFKDLSAYSSELRLRGYGGDPEIDKLVLYLEEKRNEVQLH